jgi:hypothetical protein
MISGYITKQVQSEYACFKRFTTKCLGDKISNLRSAWCKSQDRCSEMEMDGGGGQGLCAQNNVAAAKATRTQQHPDNFDSSYEYCNDLGDNDYEDDGFEENTQQLNDAISHFTIVEDEY